MAVLAFSTVSFEPMEVGRTSGRIASVPIRFTLKP